MSAPLLAQLQLTLTQLGGQSTAAYSLLEQHALRHQLTSTIKTLHALYPDGLSFSERQEFIATLLPLEQQFLQVTVVAPVALPLATWQTLHQSLQTVITKALALLS
jgi:hypothetical protein